MELKLTDVRAPDIAGNHSPFFSKAYQQESVNTGQQGRDLHINFNQHQKDMIPYSVSLRNFLSVLVFQPSQLVSIA